MTQAGVDAVFRFSALFLRILIPEPLLRQQRNANEQSRADRSDKSPSADRPHRSPKRRSSEVSDEKSLKTLGKHGTFEVLAVRSRVDT